MKLLKCFLLFAILMAFAPLMQAQVTKTFTWDASASAATAPPANPVKYRLYMCSDAAYSSCSIVDAATNLQADLVLQNGTCWIYATAYWFSLVVNDVPQGPETVESGKSNVLKAEVKIPPGNPGNAKIKITQVASSESGQRLRKQ